MLRPSAKAKKANAKIEQNMKAIEDGNMSQLIYASLADTLVDVETTIIEEVIIRYRQGTLTSEQARDKVAEIAGLRRLVSTLETKITRGTQAKREEMKNG